MTNLRAIINSTVDRYNGGEHMKEFLSQIAAVESGGDRFAKNTKSSATGYFQQTKGNWEAYGRGGSRTNPQDATDAAVRFALDNGKMLRRVLGREPSAGEYYLAHFAGTGGAEDVLRASGSTPIANILTAGAISANAPIKLNGKRFKDFTAADLRAWADQKMGADVGGKAEYNDRYASGGTSPEEDALEYNKRIKYLVDNGYEEDAARKLSKDEVFGLMFLKIILNMFDSAVSVPEGKGTDDNRTAGLTVPPVSTSVADAVKDAGVAPLKLSAQLASAGAELAAPTTPLKTALPKLTALA